MIKFVYAVVTLNILSSGFKLFLGLTIPSVWFLITAGYYILLSILRLFAIRDFHRIKKLVESEVNNIKRKNYVNNGIIFLLLSFVQLLSSSIIYHGDQVMNYKGYMVYALSFVSFVDIGIAIYGMIKYHRNQNTILSSIKITNFVSALVSILTTQIVLLSEFGESIDYGIYNASVGYGISGIIFLFGIYMMVSSKRMKKNM